MTPVLDVALPRRWRPWLEAARGALAGRRAYRARLAASEARFEAAAEGLLDGLAIFDAEDRLVYHNGRYPEHLAPPLRATLALGKRWPDWLAEARRLGPLYHPEMGEGFAELRLREQREPACDRELRLADGRWLRVREGRTPDGGRVQLSADVTTRKEAEARHHRLPDAGQRSRGHLAVLLRQAQDRLSLGRRAARRPVR